MIPTSPASRVSSATTGTTLASHCPDAPTSVQTLRAASLVSILFLHVSLQSRKHAAIFSQAILSMASASALTVVVHTLEVSMMADPTSVMDEDGKSSVFRKKRRTGSKKDVSWPDLAILVACCPHLADLRITNITGTSVGAEDIALPATLRALTLSGEASTDVANLIGRHTQQLTSLTIDLLPRSDAHLDEAASIALALSQSIFGAAGQLRSLALRNAVWHAPLMPASPACASTLRTLALNAWTPELATVLSSGTFPNLETFELSGCRGGFQVPSSKPLVSLLPDTLQHLKISVEPWTLTLTGRDEIEAAAVEDLGLPPALKSVTWECNAFIPTPTALETAFEEACRSNNIHFVVRPVGADQCLPSAEELEIPHLGSPEEIRSSWVVVDPITVPKRGPMRKAISWVARLKRSFFKEMQPWEY
ncbi:hypothetical protein BKA62DRAFT_713365 [Auriculariales sp. MPI-PUGE-AT-0066]|nr:hypothetical protein BKA62DRAFT_713365 [Auriculariales sp. MPI-PUGE-AT-0066]